MSPQDPSPSSGVKESFEMANHDVNSTDSGISPTTAEQASDTMGGNFASPVAPQALENPEDHLSKQLEDLVLNSGLNEDQPFVSETDRMLKLPRYMSEGLYVVDLHPLAIENVTYLVDLFSRVGTLSVAKVISPKPPGTPGIPSCTAYINYLTVEDACLAWQTLNYHVWMGQPMRIMFSNLDPATRYNDDANIIVTGLEESIDSKFLHHRFCKHGAVVSSKVAVDSSGKSTGRAFIQFEDEIDAKRAIEVMNNEKLRGKKVYVGPFIRRQVYTEVEEMNRNPIDQNPPAQNPHVVVTIPSLNLKNESLTIGKNGSRDILLGSSSTSGEKPGDLQSGTIESRAHGSLDLRPQHGIIKIHGSSFGKTASNAADGSQTKERERNLRRGTKASRNLARKRFRLRQQLSKETRMGPEHSSQIAVDLSAVLSSEPWPPQPWSFETLKAKLTKSHSLEERLAMLGATLFPLVARHTKTLVSDVTNVLVNLDLAGIERIMHLSEEDLHRKVEELKQCICEGVPAELNSPTAVDKVAEREKEKPVNFVEEIQNPSRYFPARAPLLTPPAPAPLLTLAPTEAAQSLHFQDLIVPSSRVPAVHEFSQAPALPGFSIGIPVHVPVFPLAPLPPVMPPPAEPRFRGPVLNYTDYTPRPGTGFYEPRVSHRGDLYSFVAALARAYRVYDDIAEESAEPVEDFAHTERAQVVEEPVQLMTKAFARVVLAPIVEESAEQMEECAEEEQAEVESTELMGEVDDGEQAQAVEESAEIEAEVASMEQVNQVLEQFAQFMQEVINEEQALAMAESAEMIEEVADVELANPALKESAESVDEFVEEEQATRAQEESVEPMQEVAHVEQALAVEEPAELLVGFREEEQPQAQPSQESVHTETQQEQPALGKSAQE